MMTLSRRQFTQRMGATVGALAFARSSFGFAEAWPRLGLNTYSLRLLSQEEALPVILQVMKQTKLQECELWSTHVEPAKFATPIGGGGAPGAARTPPTPEQLEQRKALAAGLAEWRLSTPMSYFENVRASFEKEGLRIKSYNARIGASDAEIDRQFLMAKALGADSMITRLTDAQTASVAAAADKHQFTVGLQFSDLALIKKQLAASKYFTMDPDIGDLTRNNNDALQFVQDNYKSISSLDMKDYKTGTASVPFGEGDAHMKEVVQFLKSKSAPITLYIDCDYPGTGKSTDEIAKCVTYVRGALA
jgi:hypothetical protein